MSDDFEARLKQLLNEDVDARLGAERPAPPRRQQPASEQPARARRRPTWLPPLLAAAVIAVVAVGGVASARLLSDDRNPADPVGPTPTVRTTTPTATVALGARVGLPTGWRVGRTLNLYAKGTRSVCLQPSAQALVSDPTRCPIVFLTASGTSRISADDIGAFVTLNGFGCNASQASLLDSADRRIGNRLANWRVDRCDQGTSPAQRRELYAVVTDPGYVLFTQSADAGVRQAITTIAQQTQLPAQDRPLRLYDYGVLQQVQVAGDVVRIKLDRTVPSPSGERNNNPTTYAYTVPIAVWRKYREDGPLSVGSRIQLQSDGTTVTQVLPRS